MSYCLECARLMTLLEEVRRQAEQDREAGKMALRLASNAAMMQGAVLKATAGMDGALAELEAATAWPASANAAMVQVKVKLARSLLKEAWSSIISAIALRTKT